MQCQLFKNISKLLILRIFIFDIANLLIILPHDFKYSEIINLTYFYDNANLSFIGTDNLFILKSNL